MTGREIDGAPPEPAFGGLLRGLRREAGLTQEALAERAGLSRRGLQHLEAGDARPYPATLEALAAALALAPADRERLRVAAVGERREREPTRAPPGGEARGSSAVATLPVPLSSFVGRDAEVEAVRRRLLDPDVRLLTLTGPGGVGKTRLALQAAAAALASPGPAFEGVVSVPLVAVPEPGLVPAAVASALALREPAEKGLPEALQDYLRDRALLLLLDNFEHLLPAAALLPPLLMACPRLTVLATSRAPLRLSGEHDYAVGPLPLPDAPPPGPHAARLVAGNGAVRLFVERARAARSGFALTEANAGAVAQLCRRLDGLPLAIELAAARVRFLPPDALLTRLGGALPLLTGGPRDAPAHHRSLRAAIAWSHGLLAPDERVLFRRLAVFAGGCTPDAAAAVCGAPGERDGGDAAPAPADVFDALAVLVEHSLVQPLPAAPGLTDEPRFGMLETVREFAAEQLEAAGEGGALRSRHAAHCVALAERAEREAQGPLQVASLDRFDAERGNLRAALQWYRESGEAEGGLRLACALWRFWWMRGPAAEGREWLGAFLDLPGAPHALRPEEPGGRPGGRALLAARARAHFALGMLAQLGGDEPAARAAHERSLATAEALGDAAGAAYALHGLARCAIHAGAPDEALDYAERSTALFEGAGDEWGRAFSLELVVGALEAAGAPGRAAAVAEESLALWRRRGDPQRTAVALDRVALATLRRGDSAGARARYEESLTIKRLLGDRPNVLWSLIYLADVARQERDWTESRARYEEAVALARDLGERRGEAYALNRLAWLALQRTDLAGARALVAESLALARDLADGRQIAWCLHTLAELEQRRGQTARAARLAGAAHGLVERLGLAGPDGPAVPLLGPAAGAWDDPAAAAWAEGRALSLEQAVADALRTATGTAPPGAAARRKEA